MHEEQCLNSSELGIYSYVKLSCMNNLFIDFETGISEFVS